MPRQPPPEKPLELASDWLRDHAFYAVPEYKPPNDSTSTYVVDDSHARLVVENAPVVAFHDKSMHRTFIAALERALGNKRLQSSIHGNDDLSASQVRYKYEKLFEPEVKFEDEIPKDDWLPLTNEVAVSDFMLAAVHM